MKSASSVRSVVNKKRKNNCSIFDQRGDQENNNGGRGTWGTRKGWPRGLLAQYITNTLNTTLTEAAQLDNDKLRE